MVEYSPHLVIYKHASSPRTIEVRGWSTIVGFNAAESDQKCLFSRITPDMHVFKLKWSEAHLHFYCSLCWIIVSHLPCFRSFGLRLMGHNRPQNSLSISSREGFCEVVCRGAPTPVVGSDKALHMPLMWHREALNGMWNFTHTDKTWRTVWRYCPCNLLVILCTCTELLYFSCCSMDILLDCKMCCAFSVYWPMRILHLRYKAD